MPGVVFPTDKKNASTSKSSRWTNAPLLAKGHNWPSCPGVQSVEKIPSRVKNTTLSFLVRPISHAPADASPSLSFRPRIETPQQPPRLARQRNAVQSRRRQINRAVHNNRIAFNGAPRFPCPPNPRRLQAGYVGAINLRQGRIMTAAVVAVINLPLAMARLRIRRQSPNAANQENRRQPTKHSHKNLHPITPAPEPPFAKFLFATANSSKSKKRNFWKNLPRRRIDHRRQIPLRNLCILNLIVVIFMALTNRRFL